MSDDTDWEYEQFVEPMEYDPDLDCGRCGGTGEVPTEGFESVLGKDWKECPSCNGTGRGRY